MRVEVKDTTIINASLSELFKKTIYLDFKGISIDSRNVKSGDLFIALQGDRAHGSEFINKNILNKVSHIFSDVEIKTDKCTVVDNSKEFLITLAQIFRKNIKTKIIGITGTNGKTTTKELLVGFLESKYDISYSRDNYNTTISLPLSLLGCDVKSDYCILEMGASKSGEIKILSDICKPDFGIITNISQAHIEGYSSFQDLVKTKLDLFKFINSNKGTFFLNKDDSNICQKSSKANCRIISYSTQDLDCNFSANLSELDKNIIIINGDIFNIPYNTSSFAYNFLASYSVANSFGVTSDLIQNKLNNFELPDGRGRHLKIGNHLIIDDSYNANLESMISGISQLEYLNRKYDKIILILGDMLELGDQSVYNHEKLGNYINNLNFIDLVCGYGEDIKYTLDCICNPKIIKKYFKKDSELLSKYLKDNILNNNIFYFKGSRSLCLNNIIQKVF